jgi:FkbM family methyltransferase
MRMKSHPQYFISKPRRSSKVGITIGIDLGDIWSHYCTLNEDGEVVDRGRFRTNPSGVGRRFRDLERARVAMETGTHSIWVSEQIQELGHEVIVLIRLPGETRYWRGDHEPGVQRAILEAMRSEAIVYDIGAHVGTVALGTARLVGEFGRVIAFDGDQENVERLRGSIARNGLESNLEVVHAAVWSRTASDGISFRRGATARSQGGVSADGQSPVIATGEIIKGPAITLDDFVATAGPPPQLIKIDVEGGEYEVLRGGERLFESQRPLLIAEIHHQQAAEQITAWLSDHRYEGQWNIPKEKFPQCLFAWPAEQDGNNWMRNISLSRGV